VSKYSHTKTHIAQKEQVVMLLTSWTLVFCKHLSTIANNAHSISEPMAIRVRVRVITTEETIRTPSIVTHPHYVEPCGPTRKSAITLAVKIKRKHCLEKIITVHIHHHLEVHQAFLLVLDTVMNTLLWRISFSGAYLSQVSIFVSLVS
jgi:hypothetical protein